MKNTLLNLMFFFVATICYGQDSLAISDETKTKTIVSRLTRELQLNEDQQTDVGKIMQRRWQMFRSGEAFTRINEKTLTDLKKILTDAQFSSLQQIREDTKKQKQSFLQENADFKFSAIDEQLQF